MQTKPHAVHKQIIPTKKLNAAKFNPDCRTTPSAIASLKSDIQKNGVMVPLHVVAADDGYIVVDGHRRHGTATVLGIEQLDCIVHDVPISKIPELWASLNKARPINAREWMIAWYKSDGAIEKAMPPSHLRNIREAMKIFGGRPGIAYLIEQGVGASCWRTIRKLHERLAEVKLDVDLPAIKQVGMWLVKHRGVYLIIGTLEANKGMGSTALRKIAVKIQSDRPITWEQFIPSNVRIGARRSRPDSSESLKH